MSHVRAAGVTGKIENTAFAANWKKKYCRRGMTSLVAAAAMANCLQRASAVTVTSTWVGGTSIDWSNAANWNPNSTFPDNGNDSISDFDVLINAPTPLNMPSLDTSVTIDSLTMGTGDTLSILGTNNLTLNGSITDNGSIVLNSDQYYSSTLSMSGGTISGSGTLTLDDGGTGAEIIGSLTQAAGHTINGYGTIAASLINNGAVDTNVSGQTLTLETDNITNNNLIEATAGATLNVNGITITQGASGQIDAGPNSTVEFNNATFSGGTLVSSGTGVIYSESGTNALESVTNNSTFDIAGTTDVNVTGNLADNGLIVLNYNQYYTSTLTFSGGNLSGNGTLNLDSTGAYVVGTFTQTSGHTINGYGQIDAAFTNNGTVDANVSGQTLSVQFTSGANNNLMESTAGGTLQIGGPVTNNATIEATGGNGTVDISGASINQAAAGQILIGSNESLDLNNATITGGILTSSGTIVANLSATNVLSSVNFTNNGTFDILGGNSSFSITGNVVDNGSIVLNSDQYYSSTLSMSGGTISGSGTLTLDDGGTGATLAGSFAQAAGHTIDGYGTVTASVTNQGLINADVAGQTLVLSGANIGNTGIMEATSGTLVISGTTVTQGPAGQINAPNSTVELANGATVTGGTLNSPGSGLIQTSNATIGNLTNNATVDVLGTTNLTISGPVTNNGSITVNSDTYYTSTVFADGAITGTGTLSVLNGGSILFGNSVGGSTQSAVVLSGSGSIDLNNNHLFIHYGSNTDPIASIQAYLTSGYAGGAWDGTGIYSSAAAANTAYALGYADSADHGNPASLSSGTIEVKYTLYGDANLDGVVNSVDFGVLAANFGESGKVWDQGNFNYNASGVVNSVDFGLLATNFGKSATGADVQVSASDWAALYAFAEANGLMSEVPEPTCGAIMLMTLTGALIKRRRR